MRCIAVRTRFTRLSLSILFLAFVVPALGTLAQAQGPQDPSPANRFREMRRAGRVSKDDAQFLLQHLSSEKFQETEAEFQETLRVFAPQVAPLVIDELRGKLAPTADSKPSKESVELRRRAALAVGGLGVHGTAALPELRKMLQDQSNYRAEVVVAIAIGRMGEAARPAVPELLQVAISQHLMGDPKGNAGVRVLVGLGTVARSVVPELRTMLKSKNLNDVEVALEIIEGLGESAVEALPDLLELATRPKVGFRAHALRAMKKMPAAEVTEFLRKMEQTDPYPWVRAEARDILSARGDIPRRTVWQEDPRLEPTEAEPNLPLPFAGNRTQLCEAMESVLANRDWNRLEGLQTEFRHPADSWDISIVSMSELLLSKWRGEKKTPMPQPNACSDSGTLQEGAELENFSTSVIRLMERAQNPEDPHWSSTAIYAKIYRSTLLRQHGKDSSAIDQALIQDIGRLRVDGLGGSALNTYALGAALVALGNAAPKETFQILEDWVASHRDPLALRYAPSTLARELRPETRKGAAARNVPVYLALYARSGSPNRRETLIASLKNWMKHAGDLAAEVPRNGTHNREKDGIAPYYFFPSLPYVTAAIKKLLQDPELSEQGRTEVAAMKASLRQSLPKFMKDGKLQLLPGDPDAADKYDPYAPSYNLYPSAPAYTYPLYGLALIPLLEEGDSCFRPALRDDLGVVPAR